MVAMKNSSLADTRRNKRALEFPKALSPENYHHLVCLAAHWKLHSQGLSLFDMTQNSLCANSPIYSIFVKNNQWQLFNIAAAWGSITKWGNKGLTKKNLKGKTGEWHIHTRFENSEIFLASKKVTCLIKAVCIPRAVHVST